MSDLFRSNKISLKIIKFNNFGELAMIELDNAALEEFAKRGLSTSERLLPPLLTL
jgi:hypothetical protein